ncbi:methyltransferase domain-containing protein [Pontiellaceae bacterium B1224]|nr:methyltransferase domain-containing protein [Pontiellaceae bacterium B1224]
MLDKIVNKLTCGSVRIGKLSLKWNIDHKPKPLDLSLLEAPYKIHLGPGPNWKKTDPHWIDVDIDPQRGDVVVDFGQFTAFPLASQSVSCIYGSHVFEHMSIYITPALFKECCRVLQPGGTLRLILPDVEKSIREYAAGNADFEIFRRRAERAKKQWGVDNYTMFDCLREDFLSRSGQPILGENALAHQNAWDFETIRKDLREAGFSTVEKTDFQQSGIMDFSFEGTYPSEANEKNRSLYVEAVR